MPVEHRLGRHKERAPPLTRDEAGEQGDERPVGPAEAWPPDLASEHRQLVAQDEYLGVLPQGIPPVGTNEPEHPTEELVEEGQGHGSGWLSASELVKSHMGVIGPYKPSWVLVAAEVQPRPHGFQLGHPVGDIVSDAPEVVKTRLLYW